MLGRTAVVPLLLAAGFAGYANAQPMKLSPVGGGLGQTLTMTLSGPPSASYALFLSLSDGPTALPPPHIPSIDVGLELASFSLSLPGFLGTLPPSGTLALPLPVPNDPVLDGLEIDFQSLRLAGSTIVEKSNLCRVTFDTPGQFAFTLGSLATARAFAAVEKLSDGTVLVAGGGAGSITSATGLSSAERYVPTLEEFQPLGSMTSPRALHRSTRLADGRVLLTGGVDDFGAPLASAEIFDPATGTFASTGSMGHARVGHTAAPLADGRVLVVGGSSSLADATAFITSATNTSEIFNPLTGAFTPGPNISSPRTFHEATRLADGRVLISGGITFTVFIIPIPDFSSASQIYTPNAGAGTFGGNVSMGTKRAAHTSVLLADGRVLIAGGGSGSVLSPSILASCQIFNPATSSFATTGSLATARAIAPLVRMPDGRVLASGGAQGDLLAPTSVQTCERYDLATGTWSSAGSMLVSRQGHGAVLLDDLTVALIAGAGGAQGDSLPTAEILQP